MTSVLASPDRRPSLAVGVGLATATAACWAYLVAVSAAMGTMDAALAMPMTAAWSVGESVLMWVMWAVMMAAMMLPSATPMVAAYARAVRAPRSRAGGSTALFVAGYVALWAGVAGAATGAQWVLHRLALVDAMGASTTAWLAAPVLVAAGAYQLTALKRAMLARCRSPLGFMARDWRDGPLGALVMGAHHGALCLGCCWALMALLFVLGVMNLWWVALLATAVLAEKLTRSDVVPRALGLALIVAGAAVAVGA